MNEKKLNTIREDGAIWSNVWDKRYRWCLNRTCLNCENDFLVPENQVKRGRGIFCSRACYNSYKSRNSFLMFECANCRKSFKKNKTTLKSSKHGYYFCSRKCKEEAQSIEGKINSIKPSHYIDGASVYRTRAFRAYGTVCNSCGYKEDDRLLDVHHKDGNRSNASLENLEVLCVMCHAKITRKNWRHYSGVSVRGKPSLLHSENESSILSTSTQN